MVDLLPRFGKSVVDLATVGETCQLPSTLPTDIGQRSPTPDFCLSVVQSCGFRTPSVMPYHPRTCVQPLVAAARIVTLTHTHLAASLAPSSANHASLPPTADLCQTRRDSGRLFSQSAQSAVLQSRFVFSTDDSLPVPVNMAASHRGLVQSSPLLSAYSKATPPSTGDP